MSSGPVAVNAIQPLVNCVETGEDYTLGQNDGIIIALAAITLTLTPSPLTGTPLAINAAGGAVLVEGPIQGGPFTLPQGAVEFLSYDPTSATWSTSSAATPPTPPTPPTYIASYYGDNGLVPINVTAVDTVLATVPGVVALEGQNIIIHATVFYTVSPGGGKGTIFTGVYGSNDGGMYILVDGTADTSNPNEQHTVTRVFELQNVAAGTYSYQLRGNVQPGLTGAVVSGIVPAARLTVEVVAV
jgi:hypothetical protein